MNQEGHDKQSRSAASAVLHWLVRGGRWIVTAVLGAMIGTVVTLVVVELNGDLSNHPAPLPAQLNSILADAARQGFEPVYLRELDLQGTGEMSRLVVLRPRIRSQYVGRSDELRVYRTANPELKLALHVRPIPLEGQVPYHLTLLGVGSFDRTDREEAIFTLDPEYADTRQPRPVALVWNVATQTYEVRALLREAPRLVPLRGAWAEGLPRLDRPLNVPLAGGGMIRGARGGAFVAVARSRLAAAYAVRKTCNGCTGVWEFKTFCLNFENRPYPAGEAGEASGSGRERHYLAFMGRGANFATQLNAALHRGYCE